MAALAAGMKVARYLAARFAVATALCWGVLVGLLLAVVWVEGTGHLARTQGGAWAAFSLALLGSAQVAWQVLPVATLLGLVVASTQLARSGELVGLLATGHAPTRLARPFVVVAGATMVLGWAMAAWMLPPVAAMHAAMQAATTGRVDASTRAFSGEEHWFRRGNYLLFLPRGAPDTADCLHAPVLYEVRDARLVSVTDARALRWQQDRWQLEGAQTHRTDSEATRGAQPQADTRALTPATKAAAASLATAAGPGRGLVATPYLPSSTAPLPPAAELPARLFDPADGAIGVDPGPIEALPQALAHTHGAPKQQRSRALRALITRREAAGIVSWGHRLEAGERRAYPTLCLLLVLLALPWALRPERKRSLVAALGLCAAAVAAVLALSQTGRMLAASGAVRALVGSWLAPGVVALAVPYSARRAQR